MVDSGGLGGEVDTEEGEGTFVSEWIDCLFVERGIC